MSPTRSTQSRSHPQPRRRRMATLAAVLACAATAWVGSPTATASPTPTTASTTATTTPAGGPVSPALITTTAHPGNQVALTFDDGPSPQYTPQLLQVLKKHQVKAVFCVVGEQVEWQEATVRAIVADGHTLCNHTYRHRDLTTVSPAEIEADIKQTDARIRAAVPGVEIPYFRAPYGNWGQSPAVAANLGLRPLRSRFIWGVRYSGGCDDACGAAGAGRVVGVVRAGGAVEADPTAGWWSTAVRGS